MKLTPELKKQLEDEGYYAITEVPGRGICAIHKFIFTCAIVYDLDESGYVGRYCYHNCVEALMGLAQWDGEGDPKGNWIKHKGKPYEYTNPNYQLIE